MNKIVSFALFTFAVSMPACASADRSYDDDVVEPDVLDAIASELGAAPTLKHVALRAGVTLQYLEQGSQHGDPVILLHGYTDSHHTWDLDLPRLPRRYHVYALDQRGHGDSSKPACCYTQADFAGDVAAFMDALGIAKASVVGHSMGSLIAHKVAVDYPARVDKLVLVGSAPTAAGNEVAAGLKEIVDTLTDPVDPTFIREFQSSTFFRPIPASYLDTLVSESQKVPAAIWRQALDGLIAEDHASALSSIRAERSAIFWGDQDIFFGRSDQDTLDAEIPRSTLYVYPQTGHGPHAEVPKEFVRDLARFLR